MNWSAIGALGEVLGAVAVLVTLIYLAVQVKQLKAGLKLSALQNIVHSMNDFVSRVSSSESIADILVRGRASYEGLSTVDKTRFDHIYFHLMNIIESWHSQIVQTTDPGPYRDEHLRNIGVVIRMYCDFPGVIEYWREWQLAYSPETRKLFEENTGSAPGRSGDTA